MNSNFAFFFSHISSFLPLVNSSTEFYVRVFVSTLVNELFHHQSNMAANNRFSFYYVDHKKNKINDNDDDDDNTTKLN